MSMMRNSHRLFRNRSTRLSLLFLTATLVLPAAAAEFAVADIFSDHMILQQGRDITIWGTAPTSVTSVSASFANQGGGSNVVDGQWRLTLPPMKASAKPQSLTVSSDAGTIVFRDVLVGEVWYASGQSNMDWKMKNCAEKLPAIKAILDAADYGHIRYRAVKTKHNASLQDQIGDGKTWSVCTPATAAQYSAVAFLTARRLHEELKVPVGIIESAWGGHPIEPFIPRSAFTGHPVLEQEAALGDKGDLAGLKAMTGGVFARNDSWLPGTIFNSRVAPVAPYAVRGAFWYQAESNCGKEEDPRFYAVKMKALIRGWRGAWEQPQMPVYFVQLPQYSAPGWVPMRDEQRRALSEPHTGMAVTIDLALASIHPANKLDVAERLARWPLAKEYGRQVGVSGPLFSKVAVAGDRAVVHFDHADGLQLGAKTDLMPTKRIPGDDVSGFEIIGKEGTWYPATAKIVGDTVVCSSWKVSDPIGVRYAWAPTMPKPNAWNLYNNHGLPASPFISDPELAPYTP
jgi:sialate O-acetylesterase